MIKKFGKEKYRYGQQLGIAILSLMSVSEAAPVQIETRLLWQHVSALAADSMQGREAGTAGERMAAGYVGLTFEHMGLKPAGDLNSYFQKFGLNHANYYSTSYIVFNNDTLRYPREFSIFSVPIGYHDWPNGMVFVGYGIHRPDLKVNSYDGLDVKNRLVVIVSPEYWDTKSFPPAVEAKKGDLADWAQEQGAAGAILLSQSTVTVRPWNGERRLAAILYNNSKDTSDFFCVKITDGEQFLNKYFPNQSMSTLIPNRPTNSQIPVSSYMDVEPHIATNVLAIIEGTEFKKEFIVVTAHLDHLGASRLGGLDSVYNGALDNASGVASILEIARSISRSKIRPRRSIVFLATSAEEKGLLGARHFVNQPTILGEIVANVNIDVLGFALDGKQSRMTLLGGEYSDLGGTFESSARKLGLKIAPNLFPSYFTKSDSYVFAKAGIPSIFPGSGLDTGDLMDGFELFKKYYHKPSDELGRTPLDFEVLRQQTQAIANGVWELANRDDKPK